MLSKIKVTSNLMAHGYRYYNMSGAFVGLVSVDTNSSKLYMLRPGRERKKNKISNHKSWLACRLFISPGILEGAHFVVFIRTFYYTSFITGLIYLVQANSSI